MQLIAKPERRQLRRSSVFIVDFEYISYLPFSSVSIVDFEQVNVYWEMISEFFIFCDLFYLL